MEQLAKHHQKKIVALSKNIQMSVRTFQRKTFVAVVFAFHPLLWPEQAGRRRRRRRLAALPPLMLLLNGSSVFEGHPSTEQKK